VKCRFLKANLWRDESQNLGRLLKNSSIVADASGRPKSMAGWPGGQHASTFSIVIRCLISKMSLPLGVAFAPQPPKKTPVEPVSGQSLID
jgi:hypothetical protein